MEKISVEEELSHYNLEGKWNDYIAVQKEVLQVLKKEGFFEDNRVINKKTGIQVRINTKGIKETLGGGKEISSVAKEIKTI